MSPRRKPQGDRRGSRSRTTPRPVEPASAPRAHWKADGTAKVAFASRAEAERASLFARLEYGSDVNPYECDVCHRWHLASARRSNT